ncbi:MAG: PTS IIA-like nitrogen regulatory protein PtsN [Rhizobiales bacterium]|nr:PTS IIA-like nitrogen regulatory protein PtsN [Hyphomicrobiales bacterium]
MDLGDLISQEGVIPSLRVQSKKQALLELAATASKLTGLDQRDIFDTLLQRERLGSTGVGKGMAIPHGRLAGLSGIVVLFARVEHPIDFEAVDEEPVDIIFLILAPESAGADHLKALSRISRVMRDDSLIDKLRRSKSKAALYSVLTEPMASNAA